MPYITVRQSPKEHQITLEEILAGSVNMSKIITSNSTNTRTYFVKHIKPDLLDRFDFEGLVSTLEDFAVRHDGLYNTNRAELYHTFPIPKKSGGLRIINAPNHELDNALRELRTILETKFGALYHTSAMAYVQGRSTIDAVKRHQQNESQWFLKTDFSDFFGSTTLEFLIGSLSTIFPFSEVVKTARGYSALKNAMSLCFLNGGLPQGTPISPMLTNLMMIPIDHYIFNKLHNYNGRHFVYTRYADDCDFSCRIQFDKQEIIDFVTQTLTLFNAPFVIKPEKTTFGSNAGKNWMLGLMLNKDNEITVGHRAKKRIRAMICSYILDTKAGIPWSLADMQTLHGLINYYKMVEKEYMEEVVKYNNEKFGFDLMPNLQSNIAIMAKVA